MTHRTILHGTCLLGGKHEPNDPYAAECPLNPERIKRLSERAQKANKTRWGRPGEDVKDAGGV